MEAPLRGVRVLDLSRALAGPFGAMLLGDLGAEVIKIEAPPSGDTTRVPPGAGQITMPGIFQYKGESAYFLSINRNKKSILIDLKAGKGREIFYDLVKVSDVVYDNYRPHVPTDLKIDYDTVKTYNPKIICCSITGFGTDGPLRDHPSFDLIAQAMSGGMSITGESGRPPARAGIPIGDLAGGMFAVHGIMAALYAREQTGEGQRIEVSLMDGQIALLTYLACYHLLTGVVPEPMGSRHETAVPYRAYKTGDDYIVIAAQSTKFWHKLCKVIDRTDLIEDSRFNPGANRIMNRDTLDTILEEEFAKRPAEEWLRLLKEESIPSGPVYKVDQALAQPQVQTRNMVVEIEDGSGGKIRLAGNPIKMTGIREEDFTYPPLRGQHTDEILSELLGYPQDKIDALKHEGAVKGRDGT